MPRSMSIELMNKRQGGTRRELESVKSMRLRSMQGLPSKMLRDRLSSYVDSRALGTMYVTKEISCQRAVSLPRHVCGH